MRRVVGGGLTAGDGASRAELVNRVNVGTFRSNRASIGSDRTRVMTIVATVDRARPTQRAAITTLASVSLPSLAVWSQVSNDSTRGTPIQMTTIAAPTSRRMPTSRV